LDDLSIGGDAAVCGVEGSALSDLDEILGRG
jgi:hypothetical protein